MVYILFYEDCNPTDCDVYGVFRLRQTAIDWLEANHWIFDIDNCCWCNPYYRGNIIILEKELL